MDKKVRRDLGPTSCLACLVDKCDRKGACLISGTLSFADGLESDEGNSEEARGPCGL